MTISPSVTSWFILDSDVSQDAFLLWAQQVEASVRDTLTANRTYYVRTDGSNSNTGLANTAGGAFLTITKALTVAAALDCGTFNVTISVGAGSFAETVTLPKMLGSGAFSLNGAGAGSTTIVELQVAAQAVWFIGGGFTITAGFFGIRMFSQAKLYVQASLTFGTAATAHIGMRESHASIVFTANYTISGNAPIHWMVDGGFDDLFTYGLTVTLTGTPAFSTSFAYAIAFANFTVGGMTFSGAATGQRYYCANNSGIYTGGGGASYLPGNAAGAVDAASGAIYA